jgi:hypothetical protein
MRIAGTQRSLHGIDNGKELPLVGSAAGFSNVVGTSLSGHGSTRPAASWKTNGLRGSGTLQLRMAAALFGIVSGQCGVNKVATWRHQSIW